MDGWVNPYNINNNQQQESAEKSKSLDMDITGEELIRLPKLTTTDMYHCTLFCQGRKNTLSME